MPADRKLTIESDGKKIEAQIPAEWVHKDELGETHVPKDQFQAELARRVESITKGLVKPEELLADEKFLKRIAEEKKDPLMKLLNIKPPANDIDVAKLQTEAMERVRREELTPLQEKISGAEEEIGSLRVRALDAQVAEAANQHRVEPELLDLVKLYVRERVKWDPKLREWFVKKSDGSDGFEFSTNPKQGGHPYMGVAEFIEQTKKSGGKKAWFLAGTQAGPGFSGTGGGSGGTATLDQFRKMTPAQQTQVYRETPELFNQFMEQIRTDGEDKLFNHTTVGAK